MPATILDLALAAPPDRPFLTHWCGQERVEQLTFGAFWSRARRHAGWLQRQGVAPGDLVALVLPHGAGLMATFAGALWLGAVPTILSYPTFKVDPQKYRLGLAGVVANLGVDQIVVSPDLPDEFRAVLTAVPGARVSELPAVVTDPENDAPLRMPEDPTAIAFIQHSGGTTGLQKGVAVTHTQALNHLHCLAQCMAIQPQDVMYSWLPLYHDMGLVSAFLLPLVTHMPIVTQAVTDWVLAPLRMLELMAEQRCTLAFLPNFAFQFLADRLERHPPAALDLSCVRAIVNGSEPVRAANMDALYQAGKPYGLAPNALHTIYGMAENVMGITLSGIGVGEPPTRLWVYGRALRRGDQVQITQRGMPGAVELVSCGRCLPQTTVTVVDADGASLPAGYIGELVIRSNSLFAGYHRQPELTAETLHDGALWSGDLGFCLDGEVYVTGRRKDLIIVGGRNIFPEDVEAVVNEHPAIHAGRAVAFGILNPAAGTEALVHGGLNPSVV
ncbi:MAG: AMP-binding protein [Chloroflexi bacterium]|nr:AMP-binding protein [Chloroflexota bacterium]